ncbi:hypothetical protein DS2_04465 [Catenovulum agarivorans DS-2]|uniref:Twin-arginine translocation pathway signal n=1 Tax=Catenovulum agarivorans DS-2 TaxID=1328313 RepID=W7QU85_9ALTE|nr:gluconate 2-dehydrogenase subunit 3 family protein [Catenovulum agarivorans]EWH11398.1 hypothetical protein DS2_04465 [Catenovulum agarivorans DS-2]
MSSIVTNRRRLLQGLGAVLGTAAASQLLGEQAIKSAFCYTKNVNSYKIDGRVFTKNQMIILHSIVGQIIPTTDSVGATDVDCHGFIDHQLANVHTAVEQKNAVSLVNKMNEMSVKRFQLEFYLCNDQQQLALLTDAEQARNGFNQVDRANLKFIKNLTVFGFCTSEEGALKFLKYLPVPGGYQGSVPYEQIGRAWSSKAYY